MTYRELWGRLATVYEESEAKAVARMFYEVRYGLTMSDLLMGCETAVPQEELELLVQRLQQGEPIQYVLGEADFCGRTFLVSPAVLIPRPETQELCQWVLEDAQRTPSVADVEDVCTGSGCIAVTLAAERPEWRVTACDISEEALHMARQNALRHHVNVSFRQEDMLTEPSPCCPKDLIVSNPPYVCEQERQLMERNVLDWEPEVALFVPDNDPLLFYRAIARYALQALRPQGTLYFEINPLYVHALVELLANMGFTQVETREDQFGKTRMIKAYRP